MKIVRWEDLADYEAIHRTIQQGDVIHIGPLTEGRLLDQKTGMWVSICTFPVYPDDYCLGTAIRAMELTRCKTAGYHYLNPRYTVSCPDTCKEFVERARQYRVAWCISLKDIFGSGRRRRLARDASDQERRLMHTGTMVVNGIEIDPYAVLRTQGSVNS